MLENLYKRGLLSIADNNAVQSFMKQQGFKLGVKRFVAGETLQEALPVLRDLQQQNLNPILDLLGEFIDTEEGAERMTLEILKTLDTIANEPIERYMSIKPTQLGLGIGLEFAVLNAERILRRAHEVNVHVCLDMESYEYVDGTLALYEQLRERGFTNVSTVLQSYLHRTPADLNTLLMLDPKPTVRIVKGAYRESAEVAYQDKAKVDAQYRELVMTGLESGAKINVATHDEQILNEVTAFVRGRGLSTDAYEYQLLYGVKTNLQKRLVQDGHKVRVYVPYGEDWYGYFSRRLAERPANLMFVARGLFG